MCKTSIGVFCILTTSLTRAFYRAWVSVQVDLSLDPKCFTYISCTGGQFPSAVMSTNDAPGLVSLYAYTSTETFIGADAHLCTLRLVPSPMCVADGFGGRITGVVCFYAHTAVCKQIDDVFDR